MAGMTDVSSTVLQDSVERLSWWTGWEKEAKTVTQWLHKKPHREFLQARLAGPAAAMAHALNVGCDKFADWRWKTLYTVTQDLLRMEGPVVAACLGLR